MRWCRSSASPGSPPWQAAAGGGAGRGLRQERGAGEGVLSLDPAGSPPILPRFRRGIAEGAALAIKSGARTGGTTIKKVVLAYSGGLDTSIILKWLQETYGCEVVTFTADLGQGEELEPARKKAQLLGLERTNIFIEDVREEFVRDYV